MPRIEHILPTSGFMDDSVDNEFLQSGKGIVRKRVNLRPDNLGDIMANVGIKGTVKITHDLPDGENKCIGWCNDNENEAIIFFVFNENQNHSVFRYKIISATVDKIWYEEPSLGLSDDTVVIAEVIDGRVYWNDDSDQPKGFNIEKAYNYTNGISGDAYTSDDLPLDEKIFPFIKKPPRYKPEIEYANREFDPDDNTNPITFNNLRKKLWQFKYTYVYEDYQESVYSPISELKVPEGEVSTAGVWTKNLILNNAIKITVNTGSNNVKSIRVAVRDASEKNVGTFYEFKKIDKFDKDGSRLIENDSTYEVFFLNNVKKDSIDTDYGNAYFHDVPLKAKDLLLLDGRNIAMSMPQTGYDFDESELDYDLSYVENTATFSSTVIPMYKTQQYARDPWNQKCGQEGEKRMVIYFRIPTEFYQNSTYSITIPRPLNLGTVTATATTGAVQSPLYPKNIRDSLITQLVNGIDLCQSIPIQIRTSPDDNNSIRIDFYGPTTGVGSTLPQNPVIWNQWYQSLIDPETTPKGNIIVTSTYPVYNGLKSGQYHPFAIVYNDKNGRYNIAFGDKELFVPLPDSLNDNRYVRPKITINSFPPSWAETWRVAYIPYNSYLYTLFVPAVEQLDDTNEGVPDGQFFLKINQAVLRIIEAFPNTTISAYEWQNGDRLREWGKENSYEILQEYTRSYTIDEVEQIETGYLIDTELSTTSGKVNLIEIYRPNFSSQDKVYYEIGKEYPIVNGYHTGSDQSQTASQPAISTLDFGDIYLRQRLSADVSYPIAVVEDNNVNDYYISSAMSLGRGVVRAESKQATVKRAVLTENYVQNTKLNRLNVMLPQAETYEVSEVYGDITRMVERGDTLKIYQAHKETSVYIKKTYAKDANGNDIILVSDDVFGSDRPSEAFRGATYSRSVAQSENAIYFFDVMLGDFYRSSTNGTDSLSELYGMQKYLDEKAKIFREYTGNKDIITSVSQNDKTVYLSFIMGQTIETLVFSEKEKGFMFFVEISNNNLIPENFAWYGDNMYLFAKGQLYQFGVGNINEFLGSDRKSASMELVTNQYPEIQKTYEVLNMDTDGTWSAEMEIEADNNHLNGQKTKIFSGMFKSREGRLTSSVPRNIINGNAVEDIQRLYTGNKMSGNAMKIKISSIDFNRLREVKVGAISQI